MFRYGNFSRLLHFLSVSQSTLYVHRNPLLDLNCLWFLGQFNILTDNSMLHAWVFGLWSCPTLQPYGLYIVHQAPLSVGFSRQEYCSGLPCPSSRDVPDPGIEPASLICLLHLQAGSLTTSATWEAQLHLGWISIPSLSLYHCVYAYQPSATPRLNCCSDWPSGASGPYPAHHPCCVQATWIVVLSGF